MCVSIDLSHLNITGFSGFPGEGIQQPVFPQLPNMDPFQQRMMGIQQDPMRHQVTSGFSLVPLLCFLSFVVFFGAEVRKWCSYGEV